jgi:hypothetical protein
MGGIADGSHHVNPAVFIPPVSDEDEVVDGKGKWRMKR